MIDYEEFAKILLAYANDLTQAPDMPNTPNNTTRHKAAALLLEAASMLCGTTSTIAKVGEARNRIGNPHTTRVLEQLYANALAELKDSRRLVDQLREKVADNGHEQDVSATIEALKKERDNALASARSEKAERIRGQNVFGSLSRQYDKLADEANKLVAVLNAVKTLTDPYSKPALLQQYGSSGVKSVDELYSVSSNFFGDEEITDMLKALRNIRRAIKAAEREQQA